MNGVSLASIPTSDLIKEIREREGVKFALFIPLYEDIKIKSNDFKICETGPATILFVVD